MGKLKKLFNKAKFLLIVGTVISLCGCGITYYTPGPDNERIEIPNTLAYSVKVMESSKTLYNRVLTATNDLYEKDELTKEQVDDILEVANKYKAAHNTAQKGVSLWFNTYKNKELDVNKTKVIQDVLEVVAMAPEILEDVNTIAGTDLELPSGLNLSNLMNVIDTDRTVNVNSKNLCPDCQ